MSLLETFQISRWDDTLPETIQEKAVSALENGKVLYFPALSFPLYEYEQPFLSPEKLGNRKNISFDIRNDCLAGTNCVGEEAEKLKQLLKRYALCSRDFLLRLIPHYKANLLQAKTSFRPAEIAGRDHASYRKDDSLLHIDSFPSNPTKGKRILRLFTNINNEGKPRVWRVGEPFADVVNKMAARTSTPFIGLAPILKLLGITKDLRTPYDHYMLQLHDTMKGDKEYQKNVAQEEVLFAPGSSWMVYTDQVSHAALRGQHVLEQTFHLPVSGLKNESTAPLRVLEKYFNKSLV